MLTYLKTPVNKKILAADVLKATAEVHFSAPPFPTVVRAARLRSEQARRPHHGKRTKARRPHHRRRKCL